MITRLGNGWQFLLADLALILFLVTLIGLAGSVAQRDTSDAVGGAQQSEIAPAQALYRESAGQLSLAQWLDAQQPDPRATLTVFSSHRTSDADKGWDAARRWARIAMERGFRVRVVISQAERTDIHASLAYDTPAENH